MFIGSLRAGVPDWPAQFDQLQQQHHHSAPAPVQRHVEPPSVQPFAMVAAGDWASLGSVKCAASAALLSGNVAMFSHCTKAELNTKLAGEVAWK